LLISRKGSAIDWREANRAVLPALYALGVVEVRWIAAKLDYAFSRGGDIWGVCFWLLLGESLFADLAVVVIVSE